MKNFTANNPRNPWAIKLKPHTDSTDNTDNFISQIEIRDKLYRRRIQSVKISWKSHTQSVEICVKNWPLPPKKSLSDKKTKPPRAGWLSAVCVMIGFLPYSDINSIASVRGWTNSNSRVRLKPSDNVYGALKPEFATLSAQNWVVAQNFFTLTDDMVNFLPVKNAKASKQ